MVNKENIRPSFEDEVLKETLKEARGCYDYVYDNLEDENLLIEVIKQAIKLSRQKAEEDFKTKIDRFFDEWEGDINFPIMRENLKNKLKQ